MRELKQNELMQISNNVQSSARTLSDLNRKQNELARFNEFE